MTREEYAGLFGAVKRVGGSCLALGVALERWLADNPQASKETARSATPGVCAPFPSIDGNPPVYRDRPFYDARRIEGAAPALFGDPPRIDHQYHLRVLSTRDLSDKIEAGLEALVALLVRESP